MPPYESKPDYASHPPAREPASPAPRALDTLSDHELMRRLGRKEEAALEVLFDRYHRLVYAVCLRVLGNERDAEEVLTEVFWGLWVRSGRFDVTRGSVLTYVTMLARSRAIDHHRSRSARWRSANASSSLDVDQLADRQWRPAERAWLIDRGEQVREAIKGLSPVQREAVELAFFDGLTHQEIADRLGKPLGTIRTRVRLGLIRLRKALCPESDRGQR